MAYLFILFQQYVHVSLALRHNVLNTVFRALKPGKGIHIVQ